MNHPLIGQAFLAVEARQTHGLKPFGSEHMGWRIEGYGIEVSSYSAVTGKDLISALKGAGFLVQRVRVASAIAKSSSICSG
jgi:hypothetical protein